MKKAIGVLASAVLLAVSANANSFEFNQKNFYAGGGLGYNSLDVSGFDNAIGYQFFAGYDLKDDVQINDKVGLAAEVGYASSGKFEWTDCPSIYSKSFCETDAATGLYLNALFDFAVNEQIKALGRIGFDIGDDDGLMFGAGAEYAVNQQIGVRVEYVIRQDTKSLQGNVVYNF